MYYNFDSGTAEHKVLPKSPSEKSMLAKAGKGV